MNKYDQKPKAGSRNGSGASSAPLATNLRPYNQKAAYPDTTKDDARQSELAQPQPEAGQESRDSDDRAARTAAQSGDQDGGNPAMNTSGRIDASFEDGQIKP